MERTITVRGHGTVTAAPDRIEITLRLESRDMDYSAASAQADIRIGDLAEAAATSRSGLNRKMKSLMGVTPIDFIREARIQKACTMLAQGLAVNDVAYSCGFSDPKYFAKCFKADKGMTPTEFKAQNHGV